MEIKGSILVVGGDDAGDCSALVERLRKEGHAVEGVADGFRALARLGELAPASAPELVLVDIDSDADDPLANDGVAWLGKLHERDADIATVVMTASAAGAAGVAAMAAGAGSYLTKPVNSVELKLVIKRELAQRRLRVEAGQLRARLAERYRFENIIGTSAPMQAVFKTMAQVAVARTHVLLTGEPGTGKTLIAAAIHEKSPRAREPFVKLRCAGLAEAVLDGELFGRARGGRANGAGGAAPPGDGRLAQARGGTLFLDEISALAPALQLKLRRLLQGTPLAAAGGDETTDGGDIRVIAASTRDLHQLAAGGQLRPDLLERLSAIHIEMPPLRERPSDIPLLALHFLETCARARGKTIGGFTEEALAQLVGYRWPGNVRELEETVERAVDLGGGGRPIAAADLPPQLQSATLGAAIQIPGSTLDAIERYAITRTLEATGGSTTRAAEILGISIRKVQYKVQEYQSDRRTRGGTG